MRIRISWNKVIGLLLIFSGVMTNMYMSSCYGYFGHYYPPIIMGIEISQDMFGILFFGQIILGIIVFFVRLHEEKEEEAK